MWRNLAIFLYMVILFLHLNKKILIEQKIKFIVRAKTDIHATNVHLGIQITKQHLSIKLEGAVTFFAKTSFTYDTVQRD